MSCWNHSEYEIEALWSRYASFNAGIAIRTTFGRLALAFGKPLAASNEQTAAERVYLGKVKYVNYETEDWPDFNGFFRFIHKRLSFKHEREVRAIVYDRKSVDWSTEPPTPVTPKSRLLTVDLSVLIDAVVVSPLAEEWFSQVVENVARRYGLEAPVQPSTLAARPRA